MSELSEAREAYRLANDRILELLGEKITIAERLLHAERKLAATVSVLAAEKWHSDELQDALSALLIAAELHGADGAEFFDARERGLELIWQANFSERQVAL